MASTHRKPSTEPIIRSAMAHLRRADRVMAQVIEQVGPFTLKPDRNRFAMLVRSIVSQQISTSAARAIRGRLETLAAGQTLTPAAVAALDIDQLRSVGLSRQKAMYLSDLAQQCVAGEVRLDRLGRMTDERIIEQLTQVKGIGRWTAQMCLIFSLRRLDVFPHDDLGIRTALRNLYSLGELPDRETAHGIATPWRPYATVASWYCWRSLDLKRGGQG
jgi:DNA-3-methyladenine glycosylase II